MDHITWINKIDGVIDKKYKMCTYDNRANKFKFGPIAKKRSEVIWDSAYYHHQINNSVIKIYVTKKYLMQVQGMELNNSLPNYQVSVTTLNWFTYLFIIFFYFIVILIC